MAEKNQNGTTITLRVDIKNSSETENLEKFQKLLAYFVWHLEYNNVWPRLETAQFFCGTEKTMGSRTGQGYNADSIQDAIKDWEIITDGRYKDKINS